MRVYLWFLFGMLVFLFLFVLARLIIKAGKIKLVGKILSYLALAVILVLIYFMLTRVLDVFAFEGTGLSEEFSLGGVFETGGTDV